MLTLRKENCAETQLKMKKKNLDFKYYDICYILLCFVHQSCMIFIVHHKCQPRQTCLHLRAPYSNDLWHKWLCCTRVIKQYNLSCAYAEIYSLSSNHIVKRARCGPLIICHGAVYRSTMLLKSIWNHNIKTMSNSFSGKKLVGCKMMYQAISLSLSLSHHQPFGLWLWDKLK